MKSNKLIFLLFVFIASKTIPQNTNWKIFSNTDIGSQSSSILCIAQDKSYNIWIGTNSAGVFYYDWSTWTNYNKNNSPLQFNYITSIAVDAQNVKWIGTLGTSGGLTSYAGNIWKAYNLDDYGISGNSTYDIKIDKNGTFWMGSYWNGLIEFDGDTTFTLYNSSNTNLYSSLEEIISVNIELDSIILCGSEALGAAAFSIADTFWTHYSFPSKPIDNIINAIEVDSYKNIWFAGIKFVSKMDSNLNWSVFDYDYTYNFDYYHSILEIEDSTLLFTSNRGLLKLNYSNGENWIKILPPDTVLNDVGCFGLMRDHNGNIWIGYNNGYLAIYNPNGITAINNQTNNPNKSFSLSQNYPNPFNPSTRISWYSPMGGLQTLKIYDVLGNEIATLVNDWKEAGKYSVEFNAYNIPSGVYIYQLKINGYLFSKKMMLIK